MWVTDWAVAAYGARLRNVARTWRPDIIQIEHHIMAQYLFALDACPAPRVLIEHEPGASAASERWRLYRGLRRMMRYLDVRSWERFERTIMGSVQAVVVFTERDRRAVAPLARGTPVVCIPLGTTLPEQPLNPRGHTPPHLLFVGSFLHPPNVDAATRLISSILPRVQARHPGLILRIVGYDPPPRIVQMASESVVVIGSVPDVTPYFDAAAVVVVPVRLGGGMRVKVLEALAAGKAVVASPRAVEGLDLVDGEQIILAESDDQFSDAIVQLLADPEKRAALATRARGWAHANLDWNKSIAAYEALYENLIRGRRS